MNDCCRAILLLPLLFLLSCDRPEQVAAEHLQVPGEQVSESSRHNTDGPRSREWERLCESIYNDAHSSHRHADLKAFENAFQTDTGLNFPRWCSTLLKRGVVSQADFTIQFAAHDPAVGDIDHPLAQFRKDAPSATRTESIRELPLTLKRGIHEFIVDAIYKDDLMSTAVLVIRHKPNDKVAAWEARTSIHSSAIHDIYTSGAIARELFEVQVDDANIYCFFAMLDCFGLFVCDVNNGEPLMNLSINDIRKKNLP